MSEETKWERTVPRRLENVLDAMRKLARTGAKDYEPISSDDAKEMFLHVENAVAELKEAYARHLDLDEVETPTEEETAPTAIPETAVANVIGASKEDAIRQGDALNNPNAIAFFVNNIKKQHLGIWAAHISNKILDKYYEDHRDENLTTEYATKKG